MGNALTVTCADTAGTVNLRAAPSSPPRRQAKSTRVTVVEGWKETEVWGAHGVFVYIDGAQPGATNAHW